MQFQNAVLLALDPEPKLVIAAARQLIRGELAV